jgi:hypothetical protein
MKEFEGVVDRWIGGGRYGFIAYRSSGAERGVFLPASSIRKDALGRTGHSSFEGALVRFKIEPTVYKGHARDIAVDVHAVFEDALTSSVREHREVSQVVKLNSGGCSAWLCRQDGSNVFIHKNGVEPEFLDRFPELQVGDFIFHGVECNSAGAWAACNAELFSREENEKLKRGEPLTDSEVEAEPEPEPIEPEPEAETVLAPSTRNVPLIKLILERRGKS